MKDRLYSIPPQRRDQMIVQLRRRGWTNAKIGKAVGMTESGVRRALQRIATGGFGEGMTRA
jgi:hypothetical protein